MGRGQMAVDVQRKGGAVVSRLFLHVHWDGPGLPEISQRVGHIGRAGAAP